MEKAKKYEIPSVCQSFAHRLIVSCQAFDVSAFADADSMARFALAAVAGGAAGIRANGPADIRAIRRAVSVPIIGIQKEQQDDGRILITGSFEMARKLVEAGANIVALDCTARGRSYGAIQRLRQIRSELGVPVMADIATIEEAQVAAEAGADLVATTMRGYTDETVDVGAFEPAFVAALVRTLHVPIVAEGRIASEALAVQAIAAGAFAVIVGAAITRPEQITAKYARAIARKADAGHQYYLGIDLGGTNTKFGVASANGELVASGVLATPAEGGKETLIHHLQRTMHVCQGLADNSGVKAQGLGIATAGHVNPETGAVFYATGNLPGWTGTNLVEEIQSATTLPVVVENDANAFSVAEKYFGAAKEIDDFLCITLGTGVGGGVYAGGRLNRGANFFSNSLGHMTVVPNGFPCACGREGCLEAYANAEAMLRYAEGSFPNAKALIRAAALGDLTARKAMRTYAGFLAAGLSSAVCLLDPKMLIFAGGLTENNDALLSDLEEELSSRVMGWNLRRVQILFSPLGYFGGVLGAVAVAAEKLGSNDKWIL